MRVNPEIFREYDIRGKVAEDLGVELVEDIGRAYATAVRKKGLKRVTCGRDGRTHSLWLQQALIRGILSAGCDVVDIGECPTPLLYFSIFHLESHGGVEVTGSHNPSEFNGFKMCIGTSTLYGPEIRALRDTIESGTFSSGRGSAEQYAIAGPYLEYMRGQIRMRRPLKVVVDAGNGVAGPVALAAFEDLGCEVTPLYCDVDGTFPNHHPDPTVPGNLADLRAKVKEKGADIGIAYDGDGDRLGAVDEKGQILFGDQLLMIFARDILKDHPGAAIIGEVKCSHVMYEDIVRNGGRPIMWKTGHSLIKKKMRDEKALLAGEMSGHLFFADRYFGYDDGIYASLRLAEIISSGDRPLYAFLEGVPETFSTAEIRIECPDEKKFAVAEEAGKWFSERFKTIDVDGVRVVFDDGWGLIRASNTQPVLVLRFEASTRERLAEIRGFMEGRLKEIVDAMG
jgi:phosphomannomutase/phosphoglucomutase